MLKKPSKLVCSGKKITYPIAQYEPLNWFIENPKELIVFNLDGYIIDKDKKVASIFQKLEYIEEGDYNFNINDLFAVYPKQTIISILEIAKSFNCDYRLFIWKKDFLMNPNELLLEEKCIHSISLKLETQDVIVSNVEKISVNDLEKIIYNYRKRDFSSPKPLNTGTSTVGCYLTNSTKNPWPGDLDGLIYNPKTKNIGIILEFKTHNINTPTEEEHLGKYGEADFRRFEVLYNLQLHLHKVTGYEPKIVYIAWGTSDKPNHKNIKIDLIKDNKILKTVILKRPTFDVFSQELFNTVINLK